MKLKLYHGNEYEQDDTWRVTCKALSINDITIFRVVVFATLKMAISLIIRQLRDAREGCDFINT